MNFQGAFFLFVERQNIFLPISRSILVVKCAAKIVKIGWLIKIFLKRKFSVGNGKQGKSLFSCPGKF